MADQISAKEYSMWDLMSGKFIFNIPDYQRPYSWTENEAVTLWDDLVEFWHESKLNTDQSYFVGSIVLVKKSDSPQAEVIDGQQRLSTISMMLSVMLTYSMTLKNDIKKCLWEEGIQHKGIPGRPRLTLRKRDAAFFERYIANCKTDDLINCDIKRFEDDSQRLIQANIKSILSRVDSFIGENGVESIDHLISVLFNKCFFVVVTTPDNESAFRVFSVMNNRGLSLLPSDIIKAHIIGEINEDNRKYYTDKWEDVEVELGREAFNALLSHIRTIFAKAKLHGTLVAEVERFVFKGRSKKEEIITEIIEPYALAYKEIMKCEYSSSQGADDVNEVLSWLNRIDDSDWIPPVMVAFVEHSSEANFIRDFIIKIERLAAYFYLASKTSNQRIERYSRIIDALQKDKIDMLELALDLSEAEQKELINVLDGDVYLLPARKRTYVVLRLDRFLSDKAAQYKNGIFSIEHVLPQNPKAGSEWLRIWEDESTREYWTHKIANLIPLTRKKNSQAQNFDFQDKKYKYFIEKNGVSSYALTTEIISTIEWTPISVAERQKRLLGIFAKHWKLLLDKDNCDADNDKKEKGSISSEIENAEVLQQRRYIAEINEFIICNPGTKLPHLPNDNLKVGEYVRTAWHNLLISGFEITDEQIKKLCTVEFSKEYTSRNLAFLLPVDQDNSEKVLKRYWTTEKYIEEYKGVCYYVYSQWYPDHKAGSDAHKSDFLKLYIDIAKKRI